MPVGLFSEDALETSQKEYKGLRLYHARKTSRIHTNTDIVLWMLIASDPIIASKRRSHNKKRKTYSKEVLEMLDVPTLGETIEVNDDDDEEEAMDDKTDSS